MKTTRKKLVGMVWAYSVALVCGLGGYASQVDAQTAESSMASTLSAARSSGGGASTVRGADTADRRLQNQVAAALHANPYLDDEHINISVEGGVVVLRGLVFDDWDVRKALRTARKATGDSPVVDSLSIEQGGR
jgi:osmotically-inducible protein OsmY